MRKRQWRISQSICAAKKADTEADVRINEKEHGSYSFLCILRKRTEEVPLSGRNSVRPALTAGESGREAIIHGEKEDAFYL